MKLRSNKKLAPNSIKKGSDKKRSPITSHKKPSPKGIDSSSKKAQWTCSPSKRERRYTTERKYLYSSPSKQSTARKLNYGFATPTKDLQQEEREEDEELTPLAKVLLSTMSTPRQSSTPEKRSLRSDNKATIYEISE